MHRSQALLGALLVLLALLVVSGWHPYDRATWSMEVFPIVVAVPVLCATYKRFPLTTLLYVCIFLHALVLIVGGAYTYARVPLGFEIAEIQRLVRAVVRLDPHPIRRVPLIRCPLPELTAPRALRSTSAALGAHRRQQRELDRGRQLTRERGTDHRLSTAAKVLGGNPGDIGQRRRVHKP
jgi:hypothetical protein